MTKKIRHNIIIELIEKEDISSQDILLDLLLQKGFSVTLSTLSRDMKELKIAKVPSQSGSYKYQFTNRVSANEAKVSHLSSFGFISIDFSGQLAVLKTRPGYAMGIASEIDSKATKTILGTVAGDDTVLLIPKENVSRQEIINSLSQFIPIEH